MLYLQGLKDAEQLGYVARKKAFCDLSVTFLSTVFYLLEPYYLRSHCDAFIKKQMLSVTPVPCLPGHGRGTAQAEAGSHLPSAFHGFVVSLLHRACQGPSLLCRGSVLFCFRFRSPLLLLLLICTRSI